MREPIKSARSLRCFFRRRYRVVVHFPFGMGVEPSGELTWREARLAFRNAQKRARSMPGMVVRVVPLIGGVA